MLWPCRIVNNACGLASMFLHWEDKVSCTMCTMYYTTGAFWMYIQFWSGTLFTIFEKAWIRFCLWFVPSWDSMQEYIDITETMDQKQGIIFHGKKFGRLCTSLIWVVCSSVCKNFCAGSECWRAPSLSDSHLAEKFSEKSHGAETPCAGNPTKKKFPGNLVKRWFQVLAVFGSTATQLSLRKAFLEAPEELGEGDANSNLPKLSAFL